MRRFRPFRDTPRVGLALSGGAARGMAHVGVIKALVQHDISIDCIAGTSAGGLVGALYAAGKRCSEIEELTKNVDWKDLVRPRFRSFGLMSSERLESLVDEMIDGKSFEDLEIPFRAVAVDVVTGEEIVFDSGPVARAVRASSSVPGVFAPVEWEGRLLVDGGLRNNLPADVVREMGAELVISVDVNYHQIKPGGPENTTDVILAAMRIVMNNNKRSAEEHSDIIIRPQLSGFNYYDLKQAEELIVRGETAALEQMPQIRTALR